MNNNENKTQEDNIVSVEECRRPTGFGRRFGYPSLGLSALGGFLVGKLVQASINDERVKELEEKMAKMENVAEDLDRLRILRELRLDTQEKLDAQSKEEEGNKE